MGLVTAGAVLLIFAGGFPAILAGAIILGAGIGADLPASLSTIAEGAGDSSRGKQVGFSQILWIAGIFAAILLGTAFGNAGRAGAQLLYGHLAVAATVILLGRLRIPESALWLTAQDNAAGPRRRRGPRRQRVLPGQDGRPAEPAGASPRRSRALLRGPHSTVFVALVVSYAAVNLAANTRGQFGTYLLVSYAGVDIASAATVGLAFIPVGILGMAGFMTIADGPHRFQFFTVGAILVVTGNLVPAVFGFTFGTYLIASLLSTAGSAFAGEAIIKLWAQESFPTLLRTTALGGIIAVARFVAAGAASVTPAVAATSTNLLYGVLTGITTLGLAVAWFTYAQAPGHLHVRRIRQ